MNRMLLSLNMFQENFAIKTVHTSEGGICQIVILQCFFLHQNVETDITKKKNQHLIKTECGCNATHIL